MQNSETRPKRPASANDFGLSALDFGLYPASVSNKGERIAAMAGQFREGKLDPHYTGFFELFNQQKFYEAHDVLEHIWLKDKHGPNGAFFKGLIQLAGAFVHLQKNRPQPASSLFKLALANLEKYPAAHEHLNLHATSELIRKWLAGLEQANLGGNPLTAANAPQLKLDEVGT
jgi:predicted metal-dependent hydrolase